MNDISSKFYKLDNFVLMEWIYQGYNDKIDVDNDDTSTLKYLTQYRTNDGQLDTKKTRYLNYVEGDFIHYITYWKNPNTREKNKLRVNEVAGQKLFLQKGKKYFFDISKLEKPELFRIKKDVNGNTSDIQLRVYRKGDNLYQVSYTPYDDGEFLYTYDDGNTDDGIINVSKDSLNETLNKLANNDDTFTKHIGLEIKTGTGGVGRYGILNSYDNKNRYFLLDESYDTLSRNYWYGEKTGDFIAKPKVDTVQNGVFYHTVRLHLANGFNYAKEGKLGFLFQVSAPDIEGNNYYFASFAYLNSSSFETKNPRPFIIDGVGYSNYIEFKIPVLDVNSLRGSGVSNDEFFGDFYGIENGEPRIDPSATYTVNYQQITRITPDYIVEASNGAKFNVGVQDSHNDLYAVLQFANDGNYIEYYGAKGLNENNPQNFNAYLEARKGKEHSEDIVVFHELEVYEQIGTEFVLTDTITQSQYIGFDEVNRFKPVLKFGDRANLFLINYTLRIYDSTTNEQIIKKASIVSNEVFKYSKSGLTISLPNTQNVKIYNKIQRNYFENNIRKNVDNIFNTIQSNTTKLIPVNSAYLTISSQTSSSESFDNNGANLNAGTNMEFYHISDNYIKFKVTKGDDLDAMPENYNLTGYEDIRLTFQSSIGTDVFSMFNGFQEGISLNDGEVVFRIPKSIAMKYAKFATSEFIQVRYYITLIAGGDEITLTYGNVEVY